MKSNKADSIRYIPVRPLAIKPKEAFRYSVESSGTTNAVSQPVWKAASVLPVFSKHRFFRNVYYTPIYLYSLS